MCPLNSIKFIGTQAEFNGGSGYSYPKGANVCFVQAKATGNKGPGFEERDK